MIVYYFVIDNDMCIIIIFGLVIIGDEKEVNKVLCNMITNLKIKFLGADNKRKYLYSSYVKPQKNCITAIRNNIDITVDNNFINKLSFF